jgi:polygalacturonase
VSASGGGKIIIPPGVFLTGTLELKSHIHLYLEEGAVLKGSPRLSDYRISEVAGYEPAHYGILVARNASHITLSGPGIIDGNEEAFFIWNQAKKIEWGGTAHTRQKASFRQVQQGIGDGPVVPLPRPRQMVIFSECREVIVRDVQMLRSPFWTLHFADCDGVLVSGVRIKTSLDTPNSDGLDITSSSNVRVSDCDIRTGDDAIAITGYATHFELPGYVNKKNVCENITITNCQLQSRSSGIRIGFLDQNEVRNILINNVNILESNRGIGIFVRDQASVSHVFISQVTIHTRLHTGDWWGNGEPIHISAVRGTESGILGKIKHIHFRDITCKGENGILLYGSEKSRLENISFENLHFEFEGSALQEYAGGNIDLRGAYGDRQLFSSDISAIYGQFLSQVRFNNISVAWKDNVTWPFYKHGLHMKEFENLHLSHIRTQSAPANQQLAAVFLENGKKLSADSSSGPVKTRNVKGK